MGLKKIRWLKFGSKEGAASSPATVEQSGYSVSEEIVVLQPAARGADNGVRELATQILTQQIEIGRRGIALCGAHAGAGVTFTAANLAAALAELGVSTLLIEANLRAPRLRELIVPPQEVMGLTEYLQAERPDRAKLFQWGVLDNLALVYAGAATPNATELLSSGAFKDLVQSSLRDFVYTIVDTPPANSSSDARIISAAVGYSMIVARPGATYVDDVAALSQQLREDGSVIVGALLNGG